MSGISKTKIQEPSIADPVRWLNFRREGLCAKEDHFHHSNRLLNPRVRFPAWISKVDRFVSFRFFSLRIHTIR
jgi:hypothetical protein